MTRNASTRLIRRALSLAAISFIASLIGCGKASNPPAATETATTAAPAENPNVAAASAAPPAASARYVASEVPSAPKPDPKQIFKAHDRELYEKAGKLQNDEKFAEAGKIYEEIVRLNTEFCGAEHYRTRFARNRLRENQWFASLSAADCKRLHESRQLGETAMEDRAQGRPAAAIDHTKESAKILIDLGGKQTIAFGKLSELNGVSAADLGDTATADRALRVAIDVYGKTVGHPSLEESSALAAMSEMFAAQGNIQASLQCIMQAVNAESACRLAGEPDAMASYLLCKLGRRFRDLGEYTLAEEIFKQSATVARMANGIRSNEYVGCTQDLAAAYLYDGKLHETESLELEVLELIGQGASSGSNTMDILARGLLGTAYVQMGKFDLADPILTRTLDLARNTMDENSPYVGLLLGGVAELDISKKQYQAAEPLLTRAIALAEPKNDLYKPWFTRLLNDQITLLRSTGRAEEAAKVQARQQAMESSRVALCNKLRDAGLLPKEIAPQPTTQMAERPTPTTR
jgi:tetratricopeptide (TPR) repeat protein